MVVSERKLTLISMVQTAVKAAMPQLVPFYFVNEVTFTFTILPLLIYVFSKYILPRNLRLYAARLFTSKL
jgi:F-type H+-transporting ATPase subunit 8